MRVYDEVDRCYIDIETMYSGKAMPNVGENPHWRGSGSLSRVNLMKGTPYGDLVTPADLRGKAPADMPIVKRF